MKKQLFKFAAISASILAAALFVSCDNDEKEDNDEKKSDPVPEDFGSVDFLDDVIYPFAAYEIEFACTDTTDSIGTRLTVPEKYLSYGTGIDSYVFAFENGSWNRTKVKTMSWSGFGIDPKNLDIDLKDEVYVYANNKFFEKRDGNGKSEYYLKLNTSEWTDTVATIAPDLLKAHIDYVNRRK